jgi:hypothetical protein
LKLFVKDSDGPFRAVVDLPTIEEIPIKLRYIRPMMRIAFAEFCLGECEVAFEQELEDQ